MIQTVFMTDEEKRTMYAKLSKKDIIELLIESQKHVERLLPVMYYPYPLSSTGYPPFTGQPEITYASSKSNE